jgi:hypothetical protein
MRKKVPNIKIKPYGTHPRIHSIQKNKGNGYTMSKEKAPLVGYSHLVHEVTQSLFRHLSNNHQKIADLLRNIRAEDCCRRLPNELSNMCNLQGAMGELVLDVLLRSVLPAMNDSLIDVDVQLPIFSPPAERRRMEGIVNGMLNDGWRFEFRENGCFLFWEDIITGEYENVLMASDGEETAYIFLDGTTGSKKTRSKKTLKANNLRAYAVRPEIMEYIRALKVGFTEGGHVRQSRVGIILPIKNQVYALMSEYLS